MHITLDRQVREERCHACDAPYCFIRGTVYDEGRPLGLYVLALHGHSEKGLHAHTAISVLAPSHDEPQASAILITITPDEYQYSFVNWADSPWKQYPWTEISHFGRLLDQQEARVSDCRQTILHIAEHVTTDLPEVAKYAEGGHKA